MDYKCKMPSRHKGKLNKPCSSVQRDRKKLIIAQGRMKYMRHWSASSIQWGPEEGVMGYDRRSCGKLSGPDMREISMDNRVGLGEQHEHLLFWQSEVQGRRSKLSAVTVTAVNIEDCHKRGQRMGGRWRHLSRLSKPWLYSIGSHWWFLRKGIAWSNLDFKKITRNSRKDKLARKDNGDRKTG